VYMAGDALRRSGGVRGDHRQSVLRGVPSNVKRPHAALLPRLLSALSAPARRAGTSGPAAAAAGSDVIVVASRDRRAGRASELRAGVGDGRKRTLRTQRQRRHW